MRRGPCLHCDLGGRKFITGHKGLCRAHEGQAWFPSRFRMGHGARCLQRSPSGTGCLLSHGEYGPPHPGPRTVQEMSLTWLRPIPEEQLPLPELAQAIRVGNGQQQEAQGIREGWQGDSHQVRTRAQLAGHLRRGGCLLPGRTDAQGIVLFEAHRGGQHGREHPQM